MACGLRRRIAAESLELQMAQLNTGKVVHVIGALVAGGAERFVVGLVRNMAARGCEVYLLALSSRSDPAGLQMKADLADDGIHYEVGPTLRVGLRTIAWYARLTQREQPAIVHLHTPNTELVHFLANFLYRSHASLFRTVHNTDHPTGMATLAAYRKNRARSSIACSEAAAVTCRKIIKGDLQTITNGVDFNFPIRDQTISRQAKLKLKLRMDIYHFIHIGRMGGDSLASAAKAHDVLLKAWLYGGLGQQGCQLHLLGDGSLREELKVMVKNDPSVHFHGVRSDVVDWLLAADCFLMPSRYEGMPIAGIEAAGAGLPCVFTDIAPLRELNPPMGLWAPVDDVGALAEQMIRISALSGMPETSLTEDFRKRFAISNAAALYLETYATH